MGFLFGNVGSGYGRSGNAVRPNGGEYQGDYTSDTCFRLPEPDRKLYSAFLTEFDGHRILVATREIRRDHDCPDDYAADCCCEGASNSVTEVAVDATPVFVANLLAWYGLASEEGRADQWYSEREDNYYDADGHVCAIYSATLFGFTEMQLKAIGNAVEKRPIEATS